MSEVSFRTLPSSKVFSFIFTLLLELGKITGIEGMGKARSERQKCNVSLHPLAAIAQLADFI